MKKFLPLILTIVAAFALATAAFAEDATRSAETKDATKILDQAKVASKAADKLAKYKEAALKFINQRIAEIDKQIARVNANARLTADDKTLLPTDLNNAKDGLNTLKTTINSLTAADAVKTELRKVFQDYKIFAVLGPKVEGLMAVAKLNYTLDKLSTASTKIKNLIDQTQAAGKDTTAMAALYTDYQAKVSDAKTQLAAAKASFQAMKVSDVAAAKTSFQTGKAAVKLAKADVNAAHKDLQKIIPLLRVARGEASTSAEEATRSATESAR